MSDKSKKNIISRRSVIAGGAGLGALALSSGSLLAKEANKDNLPPNLPEWTPPLGDGVDVNQDLVVNRKVLLPVWGFQTIWLVPALKPRQAITSPNFA